MLNYLLKLTKVALDQKLQSLFHSYLEIQPNDKETKQLFSYKNKRELLHGPGQGTIKK